MPIHLSRFQLYDGKKVPVLSWGKHQAKFPESPERWALPTSAASWAGTQGLELPQVPADEIKRLLIDGFLGWMGGADSS